MATVLGHPAIWDLHSNANCHRSGTAVRAAPLRRSSISPCFSLACLGTDISQARMHDDAALSSMRWLL